MPEPILHLSLPVDDVGAARCFYEDVLGCRVGRVRDDWCDVWFYGLQLTLQHRPDELWPDQGVRHFGVVLPDASQFIRLVESLTNSVQWLDKPSTAQDVLLSGKTSGKFADPSGNVIEIKYYEDATDFRA